jgi:hypothetical protein
MLPNMANIPLTYTLQLVTLYLTFKFRCWTLHVQVLKSTTLRSRNVFYTISLICSILNHENIVIIDIYQFWKILQSRVLLQYISDAWVIFSNFMPANLVRLDEMFDVLPFIVRGGGLILHPRNLKGKMK